jgi:hypothetical protein
MKDSVSRSRSSPRAAASIVFACASLFLWQIYGQVHWAAQNRMAMNLRQQLLFADKELVLAYFIFAGLAAFWCIWSWLTESRLPAAVATIFTMVAVGLVTTMSAYVSP